MAWAQGGNTHLHYLVCLGDVTHVVEALLAAGADREAKNIVRRCRPIPTTSRRSVWLPTACLVMHTTEGGGQRRRARCSTWAESGESHADESCRHPQFGNTPLMCAEGDGLLLEKQIEGGRAGALREGNIMAQSGGAPGD